MSIVFFYRKIFRIKNISKTVFLVFFFFWGWGGGGAFCRNRSTDFFAIVCLP